MKKIVKIISVIALIALLSISVYIPISAASYTAEQGKTVSVEFKFNNVTGVSGTFTYSNKSIFSSISAESSGSFLGALNESKFYLYKTGDPATATITLRLIVSADAPEGSTCKITASYDEANDKLGNTVEREQSHTVTVKAKSTSSGDPSSSNPSSSNPSSSNPSSSNPSSSNPSSSNPSSSKPGNTSSKPGNTSSKPGNTSSKPGDSSSSTPGAIDYVELNNQIKIASGLNSDDYTTDSWEKLVKALDAAKKARTSKIQSDVDSAVTDLKKAISDLVKPDYTKLQEAINTGKNLMEGDLGKLINEYSEALKQAEAALSSKDQAAIDAAYNNLNDIIEKLQKIGNGGSTTPDTDIEPVIPDKFCNIPIHKLWPILFVISAVLNVAFIVLIVLYFVKRKKEQEDNTPLVSYQIEDDDNE